MRVATLNQFKIKNDHAEHSSVTMEIIVYEQLAESEWSWIVTIQQGEYLQYQAMLILLILLLRTIVTLTRSGSMTMLFSKSTLANAFDVEKAAGVGYP